MELWRKDMAMPKKEQDRIREQRRKNIVPCNSFYMRDKACPRENYLGSPENRRAAGLSIRED